MKYVVYVGGILLLTLGIALTIQSNLGASPFDALLVGLSLNVGLSVGSWEIILACVLICGNALLSKQKPEVLGLLTAFITGLGIDVWLFLLQNWVTFESWYSKVCCFGIGLIIIGVGTSAYLHTNFAPIPIDRLTLIIQKLAKTNLLLSRTLIYFTFLLAAMILNGPIGVGTLLTVFLGGVLLNFFMPITNRALECILTNSRISQNHTKDHKRSIT
ncbi:MULTISPECIES: YczE/YyaS/YitT family protein [Priestia]|uniref:YczE/YyaS/YitT family protein n=1 Tax=Priestia TaxID=2800373 RepID=UPI0018A32DFE|nr:MULTISPECIES: YitT family protein [Priestia]MDR7245106.1 putative membrane protein YczE [Priestia megaterium]QTL51058.1 YitT family protein [Priestia aryabhattai]USL44026.1 YitT family protein [Priestia megaterium]